MTQQEIDAIMRRSTISFRIALGLVAIAMFLCIMAVIEIAQAGNLQIAQKGSEPMFQSEVEAAKAALADAAQDRRYEYGGVILQCSEGYTYTKPVTSNQHDVVTYGIAKSDCTIVGQYHTHVWSNGYEKQFSSTDHASAKALGVPAYMRDPSGTMYRLETKKSVRGFVRGTVI